MTHWILIVVFSVNSGGIPMRLTGYTSYADCHKAATYLRKTIGTEGDCFGANRGGNPNKVVCGPISRMVCLEVPKGVQ